MTVLAGYKATVYVSNTSVTSATTNEAMTDDGSHGRFYVTALAHSYLDPSVAPGVQLEQDEVQTVTITGSPTGGTFTLTFGAQTTSAIAYNASAATLQAALVALSSINSGNATVTGAAGGPWTVEFTTSLGFASQALITLGTNSLTGGTSPNVTIARAQAGQVWTTMSSGYTVGYCGGVVTLATPALSAGVGVRLSTANYLTISQAMQAKSIDIQPTLDLVDITTFASAQTNNGFRSKLALLGDATVKLAQWWVDGFYIGNLGGLLVVVAYSGKNANQQLACYAYLKSDGIKTDVKAAIEESIEFASHGPVFWRPS